MSSQRSLTKRIAVFAYGLACYAMFHAIFLYSVGFIGNFGTPTRLDAPLQGSIWQAFAINGLLLGLFALQHSGMARPTFKRWWTRYIPRPIERSTYVLCTNLVMAVLFAFWQPMGGEIWNIQNPTLRVVVYAVYAVGWMIVLYSTFLINHFDLFGLRQVWIYAKGEDYSPLPFRIPSLYRYVRHPLYIGWLTVMWSAPTMTLAHLFFAGVTTAYILVAIQLEERNLVDELPGYAEYRKQVPMLVPSLSPVTTKPSAEKVQKAMESV